MFVLSKAETNLLCHVLRKTKWILQFDDMFHLLLSITFLLVFVMSPVLSPSGLNVLFSLMKVRTSFMTSSLTALCLCRMSKSCPIPKTLPNKIQEDKGGSWRQQFICSASASFFTHYNGNNFFRFRLVGCRQVPQNKINRTF